MDRFEFRQMQSLKDKQALREMLLDADPDWDVVMAYLPDGEVFVLTLHDVPVCEAVMVWREDDQIELKNLATDRAHQRKGYARQLVHHLFGHYQGRCDWMYVGTAFPGLYERLGFEYAYTVENFFIDNYPEPIIDEGRQCVDMIYYRRSMR
ncbi:GNAT family N-acetyltransferase [Eubacteriales bacterium OttesenSCG-928-N13]|nr:GNAT family N-acetyltransferase [Eubacteriales bacterium OttesenSCG-928-N13]